MKHILIVDAVEYPPEEEPAKLGGPAGWFGRALERTEGCTWKTVRA